MNSELRKWLLALGLVLSSCSFALGFLPAAEPAEPPAESVKVLEETFYLHRAQLAIALSHSPLTIEDFHSPFAIHYSPHTGAFLVTPPAPASANLSPRDFNQVSSSIFDPVNNAIRINASLTPGGTHTPNDANQVFTSIFDSINNAIYVNCVVGCPGAIGGSNTAVQFNNSSSLGGDAANFFYNTSTHALGITGAFSAASIGGLTGAVTPNAAGGTTMGSAALPFSSLYVGGAAANNTKITGTMTAPRVLTLPDANSNTVQPSSASSPNLFATGISSSGVISYLAPTATVNVANDSPGSTSIGACTITLTNGSNTATASGGNCFSSANVGTIIQYNSGTVPNFRAVVVGVSGSSITLASPFPATTTSAISYYGSSSGQPSSGTYNVIADVCGQIQASIYNHPGATVDARGITGNANCTVIPLMGPANSGGTGWSFVNGVGGKLVLGTTSFLSTRTWVIPPAFIVEGLGRSPNANQSNNTQIVASNSINGTNFTDQYPVNNSSGVTTVSAASGSTTVTDSAQTFTVSISSAACDTGAYGHFVTASSVTGLVEGQQVHIQSATTAAWNGTWLVTGVLGTSVEVMFGANCSAPSSTYGFADVVANGATLQGFFSAAATGNLTSASIGSGSGYSMTDSVNELSATDPGSCYLTSGGKSWTVAANSSGTVDDVISLSNPSLSSAAFTRTCYIQGDVQATNTGTPSQLTLVNGAQNAVTSGTTSITYVIGSNILEMAGWANNSVLGSQVRYLGLLCQSMVGCGGMASAGAQETSVFEFINLNGWTTAGLDMAFNTAHASMFRGFLGSPGPNVAPPTAVCVNYVSNPAGSPNPMGYGVDGFSCLGGSSNGSFPYAGFEISSSTANFQNTHCERIINCYRVGYYSAPRGVTITNAQPGIGEWNGFLITQPGDGQGRQTDVAIMGAWMTNTPGNALLVDTLNGSNCGSGTTTLGTSGTPGLAFYAVGSSASSNTGRGRITSDANTKSCFGNTTASTNTGGLSAANYNTFSNCLLGGATGTTSPAACGVAAAGKIAIPASQTSYTVDTAAITANSEVIVQQITDNSALPSSPACNTGSIAPVVSGRTAGTSFTISTTSVASVTCFQWQVLN